MVHQNDNTKFDEMRTTVTKKYFEDQDMETIEARPISYNAFMTFDANDTGRGLHSLTSDFNLRTVGTHRSRYSSTRAPSGHNQGIIWVVWGTKSSQVVRKGAK